MGGVTLLTAGTGYTTAPTVTVGAPGAQAACRLRPWQHISGGQVQAITIDEPGSNYSTVYGAHLHHHGRRRHRRHLLDVLVATANTVGSITVTNSGLGLHQRTARVLSCLTRHGGMGATADALLNGAVVMTGKNITEGFDPEYGRLDIRLGSTPNPLTPAVGAGICSGHCPLHRPADRDPERRRSHRSGALRTSAWTPMPSTSTCSTCRWSTGLTGPTS